MNMEHIYKEHYKRKTQSLNGNWSFCTDPLNKGKAEKWYDGFPLNSTYINVPSCWNFEKGLFDYFGVAWYKKEFYCNDCFLQIDFGAVSGFAEVYLDGEYLGKHYGGWLEFKLLKKVSSGKHSLVVSVDASSNNLNTIPLQEVDWYHYGGITRSVEITEFTDPFIDFYKISYNLNQQLSGADLSIELGMNCLEQPQCDLHLSIYINNASVYSETRSFCSGEIIRLKNITLRDIRLWNAGAPYLYDVRIETDFDDVREKIGFRKIKAEKNKIYFNNKELYLKGINRHEEHPDWGFAVPANIQKRDVDIIKDMGCNIVRGSHYPNSHTFLDYLDREGILFWSEIPMWGFPPSALADPITKERGFAMHNEMIDQYYHHPCIVMWGLHNEIASDSNEGYELTRCFSEFVRNKDSSRLTVYATCRYNKDMCLEFTDVIALNYYMGWYSGNFNDWDEFFDNIPKIAKAHNVAEKPVVMSEFGCAAIFGNSNFSEDKWTMQYQSQMLEKVIGLSKERGISGTFVWQFADVKSDININRARSFNNKGILDEYRRPKFSYYTVKKEYSF